MSDRTFKWKVASFLGQNGKILGRSRPNQHTRSFLQSYNHVHGRQINGETQEMPESAMQANGRLSILELISRKLQEIDALSALSSPAYSYGFQ